MAAAECQGAWAWSLLSSAVTHLSNSTAVLGPQGYLAQPFWVIEGGNIFHPSITVDLISVHGQHAQVQ